MKRGKKTAHRGLFSDGHRSWIVRTKASAPGVKTERERRLTDMSREEALTALAALRVELREEVEQAAQRLDEEQTSTEPRTVRDFAPLWIECLAKKHRASKRVFFAIRATYLARFLLPFFGNKRPRDLKAADFERWKAWLVEQVQPATLTRTSKKTGKVTTRDNPRAGKPYAKDTLSTAWTTAHQCLKWAAMMTGVPDPMRDSMFDIRDREPTKKEALTRAEVEAVIEQTGNESPDIRVMILLALATGMRFSELSALEWEDINFDQSTLRIQRSQVKQQIGPPKTEPTRRLVYLPPEIVETLKAHRAWQEENDAPTVQGRNVLFPSNVGTYRYPVVLKKPLAACCKLAGVAKKITAHCLRGTTNNLVRLAAGDVVARAMVGHSTAEMTFHYSTVEADERAKAHRAAFGDALALVKKTNDDPTAIDPHLN